MTTGGFQLAVICGPALGGFAYAAAPGLPYVLMAGLWLFASFLNAAIHLDPAGDRPPPRLAELFAGVRFVRSEPADPRDDLARPLRGAARRGDGADADLRARLLADRARGASARCAGRRRSARWR